jgi:hypothetical protein
MGSIEARVDGGLHWWARYTVDSSVKGNLYELASKII